MHSAEVSPPPATPRVPDSSLSSDPSFVPDRKLFRPPDALLATTMAAPSTTVPPPHLPPGALQPTGAPLGAEDAPITPGAAASTAASQSSDASSLSPGLGGAPSAALPSPSSAANPASYEPVEAEAGHIYQPGTKAEVRLVYRIKKGPGAGRHQKSFSISRYGVQGAWEQAEAARQFINANGTLPPHFVVASLPSRNSPNASSGGSSQKNRRVASCGSANATTSAAGAASLPGALASQAPSAGAGVAGPSTPLTGNSAAGRSPRGTGRFAVSAGRGSATAARAADGPVDRRRGAAGSGASQGDETRDEAGTPAGSAAATPRGARSRGASARMATALNAATGAPAGPRGPPPPAVGGAAGTFGAAGLHTGASAPAAAVQAPPAVGAGAMRPGAPGAVQGVAGCLFPAAAAVVSGAAGGAAGVVGAPGWTPGAAVRGPNGNILTVEDHQRLAAVAGATAGNGAVLNPLNPSPAFFGLFPGFVAAQATAASSGAAPGDGAKAVAGVPALGVSSVAPAAGGGLPAASGVRSLAASGLPGSHVNNPALGIVGGGLRGNFLFSSLPGSHVSFLQRENSGGDAAGSSAQPPQQAGAEGSATAQPKEEGEQRSIPEGCFRLLLPFGALSRTFFAPATAVAAAGVAQAGDVSTPSNATPGAAPAVVGGTQLHAAPGLGKGFVFHPPPATSPSSFSTTASSPSAADGKPHHAARAPPPAGVAPAHQPGTAAASCAPVGCQAQSVAAGGSPACSSSTSAGCASTVDEENQSRNGRRGSESSSSSTSSSPVSSRGIAGVAGKEADGRRGEEEVVRVQRANGVVVDSAVGSGGSRQPASRNEQMEVKGEGGAAAAAAPLVAAAGEGVEYDSRGGAGVHMPVHEGDAAAAREGEADKRWRQGDEQTAAQASREDGSFYRREEEEGQAAGGRGSGTAGARRRRSESFSHSRGGNPSWLFSLVDGEGDGEEGSGPDSRDRASCEQEDQKDEEGESIREGRDGFSRIRSYQFSSIPSPPASSFLSSSFIPSPPPSPPFSLPVRCRPGGFLSSPSCSLGAGRALKRRCVDVSPLLLASSSSLVLSATGERKRFLEDRADDSGGRSTSPRRSAKGNVLSSPSTFFGRRAPSGFTSSPTLESKKSSSLCFSALPPSYTSLRQSERMLAEKRLRSGTGSAADVDESNRNLGDDEEDQSKKSGCLTQSADGRHDEDFLDDEDDASRRGRPAGESRHERRGERDSERFSLPERHAFADGDGKDEASGGGLSSGRKNALAYLSSPISDLLASPVFPGNSSGCCCRSGRGGSEGAGGPCTCGAAEKDRAWRRRGAPSQPGLGSECISSSVTESPSLSPSPSAFLPFSPFCVPPRQSPPCGPSLFPAPIGSPSSPRRGPAGSGRRLVLLPQSASLGASPFALEPHGTPQLFSNSLPPVFSENLSASPLSFALASPSVTSSLMIPPAAPLPSSAARAAQASAGGSLSLPRSDGQASSPSPGKDSQSAAAAPAEGQPPAAAKTAPEAGGTAAPENFSFFQSHASSSSSAFSRASPLLPALDLGGASEVLQAAAKAAAAASAANAAAEGFGSGAVATSEAGKFGAFFSGGSGAPPTAQPASCANDNVSGELSGTRAAQAGGALTQQMSSAVKPEERGGAGLRLPVAAAPACGGQLGLPQGNVLPGGDRAGVGGPSLLPPPAVKHDVGGSLQRTPLECSPQSSGQRGNYAASGASAAAHGPATGGLKDPSTAVVAGRETGTGAPGGDTAGAGPGVPFAPSGTTAGPLPVSVVAEASA
ncbi:AP2 domain transcription factor AP2XII-8 [Besnoitia besnoiti]|uniref:AP2 domain transcription factor AP2XII-8 n=1 Tax=Besnoitia besnoiti TaxID=94643 RepID=A0A2A9M767_BESBE|nr:AP2 domain transcription factor AP2XII-8 [Besnoitia besnoiti]PFH31493.1 AP2 domain transcription factor AP2XII-8 [Besnoitia besnoiti]